MKSAIFHCPGTPLSIESVPDPTPNPNQVVIRVNRCGICGSDLKMTEVGSPVLYAAGAALGHEYAGEIVALGKDVKHLVIGERVTAMPVAGCGHCAACLAEEPLSCSECRYLMGGFSEYTLAEARYVAKLPRSLSHSDGALVEPLACGSQAVRLAQVDPGARVLVMGAGPIGLAAIYWARRAGCQRIVAAALSRRNAEIASLMGASNFVLQGDSLKAAALQHLGSSPDVVFECAGAPGLVGQAIELVAPRGTIVSAGMCFAPEHFVSGSALMKQIRLQFSMGYNMGDFRRSIGALEAGFVEPRAMLSETIELAALPQTLEALRTEKSRCKVMVDPWA
jgi:(R,R)-butanediol dehydrogenase/meso-butanediol dehydrogenase/diacetyl reductase